jgi:hypothetical protein
MSGKYLSVLGEYAESIYAYMENMANWGYLRYTKSSPNTRKVFKRIRIIHGKNLCVHGEDAYRLFAYSPYTPKDEVYVILFNDYSLRGPLSLYQGPWPRLRSLPCRITGFAV